MGTLLRRTAGLRGCRLAMEWAVWRWYYLSRNASPASSSLGSRWLREGEGAGSSSLTTRSGRARDRDVVIDDGCKGRAQCFCQLNRFVCPFIVHLSRFLPTLSILVRFFVFPRTFVFRFFECFLMPLLLQCKAQTPPTRPLLFRFYGCRR